MELIFILFPTYLMNISGVTQVLQITASLRVVSAVAGIQYPRKGKINYVGTGVLHSLQIKKSKLYSYFTNKFLASMKKDHFSKNLICRGALSFVCGSGYGSYQ
jgi:hypothetical protein